MARTAKSAANGTATRQRDATRTREQLLRAAQKLFASQGYQVTGVREIAQEAGVSWALVGRYFGSKQGLLKECLEDLLDISRLIEGDRSEFGDRIVWAFRQIENGASPLSMMMIAMGDPEAREMCQDLFASRVIRPLADWLGEPEGELRAAELMRLLAGIAALRKLCPPSFLPTYASPIEREKIRAIAQAIVDGDCLPTVTADSQ